MVVSATTGIRVLHLEDNPLEAELIQRALLDAFPQCDVQWVSSGAEFEAAVVGAPFDLILSDYNLPGYTGLQALKTAAAHQPDTPVIVITGTLTEDEAVACIKAGATDYMLKGRLQRLGPAIERALREAGEL